MDLRVWMVAAAALASNGARAQTVTVAGGGDELLQPDMAAEFKLVRPGTQFLFQGVTSRAAQNGFLNNDCTFGVLPDCSWSPLGASTSIALGVSFIPLSASQIAVYNTKLGAVDGPLIQFPLYGAPVAIAVRNTSIIRNAQLLLGDGELCGVLSGQLTDWSQFSYAAAPGPFQIVYDSSAGSGSTYLLTQHLNAVCNSANSSFTVLPVPITGDFSTLPVPGGVAQDSRFLPAAGSTGMQAALLGNNSAIGYIGANFTSLIQSSPVVSALVVASLINSSDGLPYLPNAANTQMALNNPGAGAINALPPATQATVADPTKWVPQFPTPSTGYPIVGYANWIFSTCYLSSAPAILQYLTAPFQPGKHNSSIARNGFVQLSVASAAYTTAVAKDLLSNQNGYSVNIQNPVSCGGRAAFHKPGS